LTREDERLWQQLRPLLDADELRPPRVRELAEALAMQPEPLTASCGGLLASAASRKLRPTASFCPRPSLASPMSPPRSRQKRPMDASPRPVQGPLRHRPQCDDRVLEYLDAIGVTRREGDARVVLRRAAEVFG